jgi:hypothetical protein
MSTFNTARNPSGQDQMSIHLTDADAGYLLRGGLARSVAIQAQQLTAQSQPPERLQDFLHGIVMGLMHCANKGTPEIVPTPTERQESFA